MSVKFLQAQPGWKVGDLDVAIAFYERLGFGCDFRNGDVHQVMYRDDVVIHLSTIEEGHGTCQIIVDNINELYEQILAEEVEILFDGLKDRDWGYRDFTMKDPFDNCITFSQKLTGL